MFKRFINWLAMHSSVYREAMQLAHKHQLEANAKGRAAETYFLALRDIVQTVEGVNKPNGTTKKLARIADNAIGKVMFS